MSYVQKDGTGTLYVAKKNKTSHPKAPDRDGHAMLDGRRVKIAGWIAKDEAGNPRLDRNGNPMLNLKLEWEVPRSDAVEAAVRSAIKQEFPARRDDLDDSIPF